MKFCKWSILAVALVGLIVLPSVAMAGNITIQVGYADSLRPSPFFPSNFCNGGTQFDGSSGATCAQTFDAGAIRIENNSGSTMIVSNVDVQINSSFHYDIWNTGGNFDILNGTDEVLSQTGEFNFDSSDNGTTFQPGDGFDPIITITFSVDGGKTFSTQSFTDTGQVLNTGGFDAVQGITLPTGGRECVGGNNTATANTPGNCNESLNWRDIGTAGFTNGGGNAPEPASILLLLTGAGGILGFARRRFIA